MKNCYRVIRWLSPFAILAFAIAWSGKMNTDDQTQTKVTLDEKGKYAAEIRLQKNQAVPTGAFFDWFMKTYRLSNENTFQPFRTYHDRIGQTHYRFKQYYKGIEVVNCQYLLHEKDGLVHHAHGAIVPDLNLSVSPTLTEAEALQRALDYVNAASYIWENPKNEAFIKTEQDDPEATYYPQGELKISAGNKEMIAENFRLVYRFNIFAEKPFDRNYVDVDAHSGEIIGTQPLIFHGDVQGQGSSLYNGMVPIIVSDANYPVWPPPPSRWHLDSWNAYTGSGQSWWIADPTLGNQGGYDNLWYEALETDSFLLSGTNPTLTFYHRYDVETPSQYEAYDGWDGMNVRISVDSGKSWQVLTNPTPAYTCTSLYSFGEMHREGPGIPGWAGQLTAWSKVSFDLSSYAGQTIQLRFAFASDGGFSTADLAPGLFGWQIDDIIVSSSAGTLFSNNGNSSGMTLRNLYREVVLIAGKYRLRETARGGGIATYNVMNSILFTAAVDFVDEDSIFTDGVDRVGVSVHWGLESTYDYYLARHGRHSYDDLNGRLLAYVNQLLVLPDGSASPNWAFWMYNASFYGAGDGTYWGPVVALDIVGHEITHGVDQFSAGLINKHENETGALSESFSDIFGVAIEFFKEGANGDWLFGEDHAISAPTVRSLENPKLRKDPDTYQGEFWVPPVSEPTWENDHGGAHSNCGVQNHWFYLLCQGGSGVNDNGDQYAVAGIGIQGAEQIAYRNLVAYLSSTSQYYDAAKYSRQAASDLFGQDSPQQREVVKAWYAVGIYLEPKLKITADSLRFVSELHQPDTLKFMVTNSGLDSLRIERMQFSTSYFHLAESLQLPLVLGKDQNRELGIVFIPADNTMKTDSLTLITNDPRHPSPQVILQGVTLQRAADNTIYAIADVSNRSFLATLNAADSGKASLIGSTGINSVRGLALQPASNYLFGAVPDINFSTFIRIDAQTGLAQKMLVIPESDVRGMTFEGDTLWAASFGGKLFKINLQTGETKPVGQTGISNLSGLAFNPASGKLWAASGSNKKLYILNRNTAQRTWERATIFATHWIAFDAGGQLFGLFTSGFFSNTNLALLDTTQVTTGANDRIIGDTGYERVFALAMRGDIRVSVIESANAATPTEYALYQNYPNPFNPSTAIEFALPKSSFVTLKIYDLLGKEVATLVAEKLPAGKHQRVWEAKGLASGVYLYRLEAGDPSTSLPRAESRGSGRGFVQTRKLILLR
jgi:Zn-dependent metalloprotease/DNA-binding beta-propeller fold protein YncE